MTRKDALAKMLANVYAEQTKYKFEEAIYNAGFMAAVELLIPLAEAIDDHVECEPGMRGNECVSLGGADGLRQALADLDTKLNLKGDEK